MCRNVQLVWCPCSLLSLCVCKIWRHRLYDVILPWWMMHLRFTQCRFFITWSHKQGYMASWTKHVQYLTLSEHSRVEMILLDQKYSELFNESIKIEASMFDLRFCKRSNCYILHWYIMYIFKMSTTDIFYIVK